MSFDGHVSAAFPGDCDVDDVVTAGEAESGPSPDSASPAVTMSPTSQSPRNLIKTLRLKGEGKLKEDESEDDLDAGSVSSWHLSNNPKDPKGGNLKPGNFTVEDFTAKTKKEIKSKAKRDSDVNKFKLWLVERKEWCIRVEWKTEHETIGEKEEEHLKHFLQQKIEGMKFKHEHTRNRLLYILDKMTGWTYVKLWWMMVLCFEKIVRGPYGTHKQSKGNEKDEGKRASSTKREFVNFTKRLDEWVAVNIPQNNTFKDNMFIQHATQVLTKDGSMSEKTKRRLNYVLEKSIGRTYSDILWMTLESFGVMVGTKGSYKNRRTADECNSDD